MDLAYILQNKTQYGGLEFVTRRPGLAIPYLAALCLMTVTGTVGNIFILGAIAVNKQLQNLTSVFLVNLAIADLCVNIFVDPFSVVGLLRGSHWFANKVSLCHALSTICLMSCAVSLMSMAAVGFNRFIFICYPNLYQRMFTMKTCLLMCGGIWTYSFLFELPILVGWGGHAFDKKTMGCSWDRTADLGYALYLVCLGAALPVIFTSGCYAKMYMHFRASKDKLCLATSSPRGQSETTGQEDATRKRQGMDSVQRESMKLARSLFTTFVVYALCWLPYAVVVVVVDIHDTFPMELHLFALMLAHSNSSINWVVYALTNRHFRQGYAKLLRLHLCCQQFRENAESDSNIVLGGVSGISVGRPDGEYQYRRIDAHSRHYPTGLVESRNVQVLPN